VRHARDQAEDDAREPRPPRGGAARRVQGVRGVLRQASRSQGPGRRLTTRPARRTLGGMGRWLVAVPLLLLAAAVPATGAGSSGKHVHRGPNGETDVTVCADAPAGRAQCLSNERTDDVALSNRPARPGVARHASSVGNNGAYDPYFLRSAYSVPAGGSGRTVAIVDAYDDPNAYADMTYYRSFFQLPPCTVESGCFQKVDQRGGAAYPRADTGWAGEIALD